MRTRLDDIVAGNSCNHLSQDNSVADLTLDMPASIASSQVQTTRSVVWNQGKSPPETLNTKFCPDRELIATFVHVSAVAGELQVPDAVTIEDYAALVHRIELEANKKKTMGADEVERIMPYMTRVLLRVRADNPDLSEADQKRLDRYVERVGDCLKRCMVEDPNAIEMTS